MKPIRAALALGALTALAACGGSSHEYTGYAIEPFPQVGSVTLPDLSNGGADFTMRAPEDGLLLVYFGYTNCPMECPTTLSDVGIIEASLDRERPGTGDRIDVAMVTVDPDRDLPVAAEYVAGCVPDGHALGTDDPAALATAAGAFGVSYQVRDEQVAHSTQLYAVDDAGNVVMTWTFPTAQPDLFADIDALLASQ